MNTPDVNGPGPAGDGDRMPRPPRPDTFVSLATALRVAALNGAPLCEVCRDAPDKLIIGSENDSTDIPT